MGEPFEELRVEKRVDEEWKEQVERERAALKREASGSAAKGMGASTGASPRSASGADPHADASPAAGPEAGSGPDTGPSSGADLRSFFSSLSMQVLAALGEIPNPATQAREVNLEQAKYLIDLLGVLQDKTRGNLTTEESRLLEEMLYELRMRYVSRLREIESGPPQ